MYEQEKEQNIQECPILDLNTLSWDGNLFVPQIVENLSLDINDLIPYSNEDTSNRENNVDYRNLRSKPLVKVDDGQYYIYNIQMLVERIYYSIFFDLKSVWKEGDFSNFYNKEFVEYTLFRNTIKLCVKNDSLNLFSYPTLEMINTRDNRETKNQPDFYIRQDESLILFECKAFKINGTLKDKKDIDELIRILKNKIYLAEENTDKSRKPKSKPDFVGVTQLIKEMELIEDDEFEWDKEIPNDVDYYPIIVLEDQRIIRPGLISMINRWAEDLIEEKLPDIIC